MATHCPKCKAENPDTSSYCSECGTQLRSLKDIPVQTKTLVTPPQELSRGTTFAGRCTSSNNSDTRADFLSDGFALSL
jgi:hypothetical protein